MKKSTRIYGYVFANSLPKNVLQLIELADTKLRQSSSYYPLEGAGLTEIITYALTTPEKAVDSQLSQNIQNLCGQWTILSSQNMVSVILDTVAYNVARKNKNLSLRDWKDL